MSLATWLQDLRLTADRFEYAGQAFDNCHMGENCPEDISEEYCEKCLPKIVAAAQRYEELPKFFRVFMRIIHPIMSFHGTAEFYFCREIWAVYQLGLSRGRAQH